MRYPPFMQSTAARAIRRLRGAIMALALLAVLVPEAAFAQACTGRFVNPITDVCWECLFPISIGPLAIGGASGAPDTPNPSSPICLCGSPIPRIGLSLGVWEPARLMDVTRTPWCYPNLGGLSIDPGLPAARGRTGSSGGDGAQGSVWHAHYYVYPLLSWIGALLDLGCLEGGSLDIAWVTGVIDEILAADKDRPKKQRHTSKRVASTPWRSCATATTITQCRHPMDTKRF